MSSSWSTTRVGSRYSSRSAFRVQRRLGLVEGLTAHVDRHYLHHVHLLFTTRQVEANGKLGATVTVLTGLKTGPQEVTRFRGIAADLINDALEDAGSGERVSPLSFEAQGIDRVPSEHLGPSASEMERDPGSSDR